MNRTRLRLIPRYEGLQTGHQISIKPSMERQLEEERVVTIILQEIIGNLYIYI